MKGFQKFFIFIAILTIVMLAFMPATVLAKAPTNAPPEMALLQAPLNAPPVSIQAQAHYDAAPIVVDWGQIITQILAYSTPLLLIALLTWLGTAIANGIALFKQHWPKWAWVLDAASQFSVFATEQAKKSGLIEQTAQAAKTYALQVAQDYLHAHHIDSVDVKLIIESNESALSKFINTPKANAQPVPATLIGSSA
jgi:hypothetical protein